MQTHELTAHPAHQPLAAERIAASIDMRRPDWVTMRWRIEGAGRLVIPAFAGRRRADKLWQSTCFELFTRENGEGAYAEFNFSPSERWAAYDFCGYREGMSERVMGRAPVCTWRGGRSGLAIFEVAIARSDLPAFDRFGLCAVIEEEGGRKSYWAIAHPAEKPDFHDPACFAARLAAPTAS